MVDERVPGHGAAGIWDIQAHPAEEAEASKLPALEPTTELIEWFAIKKPYPFSPQEGLHSQHRRPEFYGFDLIVAAVNFDIAILNRGFLDGPPVAPDAPLRAQTPPQDNLGDAHQENGNQDNPLNGLPVAGGAQKPPQDYFVDEGDENENQVQQLQPSIKPVNEPRPSNAAPAMSTGVGSQSQQRPPPRNRDSTQSTQLPSTFSSPEDAALPENEMQPAREYLPNTLKPLVDKDLSMYFARPQNAYGMAQPGDDDQSPQEPGRTLQPYTSSVSFSPVVYHDQPVGSEQPHPEYQAAQANGYRQASSPQHSTRHEGPPFHPSPPEMGNRQRHSSNPSSDGYDPNEFGVNQPHQGQPDPSSDYPANEHGLFLIPPM
jgi:hypothetical protein